MLMHPATTLVGKGALTASLCGKACQKHGKGLNLTAVFGPWLAPQAWALVEATVAPAARATPVLVQPVARQEVELAPPVGVLERMPSGAITPTAPVILTQPAPGADVPILGEALATWETQPGPQWGAPTAGAPVTSQLAWVVPLPEVEEGSRVVVEEGPATLTPLTAPRTEVLLLVDVAAEVAAEEMLAGMPEETPVVEVAAGVHQL